MDVDFPDFKKLEKLKGPRLSKAVRLVVNGKVRLERKAGESLYFTVSSTEPHQVIYRSKTKDWLCDCKWDALKKTFCSHKLAVFVFLNFKKNLSLK